MLTCNRIERFNDSDPMKWKRHLDHTCYLALLLQAPLSNSIHGQAGSLDTSFDPGSGANAVVHEIVARSDGRIILGGGFTELNGIPITRIARLNPDGSVDSTFSNFTGPNMDVLSVLPMNNGKLVLAGVFNLYDTVQRHCIGRLNDDGSLDTSIFHSVGTSGPWVHAVSIRDDSSFVIGGKFWIYDGIAKNGIAGLQPDGSLDPQFETGMGVDGFINWLELDNDGKIMFSGWFSQCNGTASPYMGRLNSDGSYDTTFHHGCGPDQFVNMITIDPFGGIMIAGGFDHYCGVPRRKIARLHPDGDLDSSFDPGLGADGPITHTVVQPDGRIIIAGDFLTFAGMARPRIARLEADGSLDLSFDPGSGANAIITELDLQADGQILIAGQFTEYDGVARNRVARILGSSSVAYDEASCASTDQVTMSLYPNPNRGEVVNVAFDGIAAAERMDIDVMDIFGKRVMAEQIAAPGGAFVHTMDMAYLAPGVYMVNVRVGERLYTQRLVRQ